MSERKLVVIVDDDASMLKGVGRLLRAYGFDTESFSSVEAFRGRECLRVPDCLLLDIHLGKVSGIELRHQLAASGSTVPVIFMTAIDDEATRAQAIAAGCIAFLRKPFPGRQLIDAIEQAAA
jgi:FixJ family two-component response regulator